MSSEGTINVDAATHLLAFRSQFLVREEKQGALVHS